MKKSNKEEIMNDMNFRHKCGEYGGVSWGKFHICETNSNESMTIALDTPDKDVFLLMDEDYNVVGVHRFVDEKIDLYNAAYNCRSIYDYVSVFYDLRVKDIVDIANRVDYSSINHGHSIRMTVNGQIVSEKTSEIYVELLSYFKFLSYKIEDYYKNLYKATMLGFTYPSVTTYVRTLSISIENYVKKCIREGNRPWPVELLAAIGENNDKIDTYDMLLYNTIDLLLRFEGYQVSTTNYQKVEPSNEPKVNIGLKASELLDILDVSKDEVQERIEKAQKNLFFEKVNLDEILVSHCKRK